MAGIKAVLLICVAPVLADTHSEIDAVTLIQSQLQEKVIKRADDRDADVHIPNEYKSTDALECANERLAPAQQAEPLLMETEAAKVATAASTSSDPPGADAFKAFLNFMIIVLFINGLRRLYLQKQGCQKSKNADMACQDEAATSAAWNNVVEAAKTGNVKQFNAAMLCKPSVMRADLWGCTLLHFAAAGGSVDIASKLLDQGADVDALDADSETPLHFAARAGHVPICELLTNAGAKVNVVNAQGMTPLMVAGHGAAIEACGFLVKRCAGVSGVADEDLPPVVVSKVVQKVFDTEE